MSWLIWTRRFARQSKRALPPAETSQDARPAAAAANASQSLSAVPWKVTPELLAEMITHARACYPREACGILAGLADRVQRCYPARNAAPGNERFFLDPEEQRAIFADIARHHWKLLAIYHSHPQRDASPSLNDLRLAVYPQALMLIISLADWDRPNLRGYRIVGGQAREVALGLNYRSDRG